MKFGEYLKLKRNAKNLKANTAAKIWQISPGYLSSLENGNRPSPSFELLKNMADVLELNVEERYRLYDLAAENKQPPKLSDDIVEYIYQIPVIRNLLRYTMNCNLTDKEWSVILNFVRNNYKY